MAEATARKPFEPTTGIECGAHGRLSELCRTVSLKRNRSTTFNVSQVALNALRAEGAKADASVGSMCGIVIDYLARNGRFPDVLKEAIAELEAMT